jgi:hypothetical protein
MPSSDKAALYTVSVDNRVIAKVSCHDYLGGRSPSHGWCLSKSRLTIMAFTNIGVMGYHIIMLMHVA